MSLLRRHMIVHRLARALSELSSIRVEKEVLRLAMVHGRAEFVASSVRRLWRMMRPSRIGFVGLAVAVAMWGFAYRLSLYHPDQNRPARTSVAKMWLGPEGTLLASKNRLKSQPRLRWTPDSVETHEVETASETHDRVLAAPDATVAGGNGSNACTPRSPPPHI